MWIRIVVRFVYPGPEHATPAAVSRRRTELTEAVARERRGVGVLPCTSNGVQASKQERERESALGNPHAVGKAAQIASRLEDDLPFPPLWKVTRWSLDPFALGAQGGKLKFLVKSGVIRSTYIPSIPSSRVGNPLLLFGVLQSL